MPNIRLSGVISISGDLFSRLHSRGLLTFSGEPTEDLFYYISECLARDTIGVQVASLKPIESKAQSEPLLPEQEPTPENKSEDKSEESQLKKIPLAQNDLASRINKLYGR